MDGALFAVCGSPACGVATEVESAELEGLWRASVPRLEDALRCTCGARGGTLIVVGTEPTGFAESGRCYLFHE